MPRTFDCGREFRRKAKGWRIEEPEERKSGELEDRMSGEPKK
jgi:hypothetical protein